MIATYVTQLSSEPGSDMGWTPWLVIEVETDFDPAEEHAEWNFGNRVSDALSGMPTGLDPEELGQEDDPDPRWVDAQKHGDVDAAATAVRLLAQAGITATARPARYVFSVEER